MRLTLRTMLAYLDDVLEPADAEELGKKIQESEFATGLVHRIRSVMRKLRLRAPKLEGKGMGLDPNTVAEYLDSTLPADRIADFEKVCLESDVHLAEVASCHQILTWVLGEPATVPPSLRQRIYRIGNLADPDRQTAEVAAAAGVSTPPPEPQQAEQAPAESPPQGEGTPGATTTEEVTAEQAAAKAAETAEKAEIPDYLRASRRSILPYVATALLVFLIALVALMAVGPESIQALFHGQPAPSEQVAAVPEPPQPAEPAPEVLAPVEPVAPAAPEEPEAAAPRGAAATAEAAGGETKPAEKPAGQAPPEAEPEEPPEPAAIAGVEPPPVELPVGKEAMEKPAGGPPAAGAGGAEGGKKTEESERLEVGRYVSEKQVLAVFDTSKDDWYRLPAGATLRAGDRLLVLPTFRPQLALAGGVQLTLAGPSSLQLLAPDERGVPQLAIEFGRLKLLNVGRAGTRLGLQLPGRQGTVVFDNPDSTLALEVFRYLPLGADPEGDSAQQIVQLVTTRGAVTWQQQSGAADIAEGQAYVMIGDDPGRTVKLDKPAEWITATGPTPIDQIASQKLESLIDEERPLIVSLEERVADDRVEVRALASRCLSYLNRHESFVAMLGDASSRAFWAASWETARAALARGPESARAVREAFEKLRGEDGKALYRLVWGYSPKQLRDEDAASQLVEYLNHESLDYRVLAFLNLMRITGLTLTYRPEVTERRRSFSVQRWRQKAEEGQIVYAKPPAPPVPSAALIPPPSTSAAPAAGVPVPAAPESAPAAPELAPPAVP